MAKKTAKIKTVPKVESKKPRERFVKVRTSEATLIEDMNKMTDYSYVSLLQMPGNEMYLLMEKVDKPPA